MSTNQKIKMLKKVLEEKQKQSFNRYQGKIHNADYFLYVGRCDGLGDALDLIESIFG